MKAAAVLAGLLALLLVPAGASAATNPWLSQRVLNIAHQGGEDEFPSNTMYAFEESLRAGADMLEIDVSRTRDGKLVVMHDWKVDRTTNGRGFLTNLTWKRVKKLDGIMAAKPKLLERTLRKRKVKGPGRTGKDPCRK